MIVLVNEYNTLCIYIVYLIQPSTISSRKRKTINKETLTGIPTVTTP